MTMLDILNPEIAFDGWAIGIILFILSCLGIGTYKYKTKTKILQKQKAGINSRQEQKVNSTTNSFWSRSISPSESGLHLSSKLF